MALSTSHNPLDAMEADEALIGERMAAAVLREVPDHAAVADPSFAAEVLEHSRRHVRTFVDAARRGRPPSGAELDFVRRRGAQRARELLPLGAVLQSYLLGQRLMWEALVERSGGDEATALSLTAATFEYAAAVNAAVAEGWTSAAGTAALEDERARRDVLDRLLTGDAAVARRAAAFGLSLDEPAVVAVAVDPEGRGASVSRIAQAIARSAGASRDRAFVVPRFDEVVSILPGRIDAAAVLDRARAWLARFGPGSLRAGVGSPCGSATEVPRAYEDARRALRHASAGRPVVRLEDVRLTDELTASADEASRRTVTAATRALAARPDLRDTVLAFAEHDLNVARTAAALHVHPNTVQYRLRRVRELTGADPRRFDVAVELVLSLRVLR